MASSHHESAPRSAASYGPQRSLDTKKWEKFFELVGGEERTLGSIALSELLAPSSPYPEIEETNDSETSTEAATGFTAADKAFLSNNGIAAVGHIAVDRMLPANPEMIATGEIGSSPGFEGGSYGEADFDGGASDDGGGGE